MSIKELGCDTEAVTVPASPLGEHGKFGTVTGFNGKANFLHTVGIFSVCDSTKKFGIIACECRVDGEPGMRQHGTAGIRPRAD